MIIALSLYSILSKVLTILTCNKATNLELLHLDVEEKILVYLRHSVLLAMFEQVFVEVEHGHGGLT